MSKRKLEDQNPSTESPQKKKKQILMAPAAKPYRWVAPDFDQHVYTPPNSSLPSPFGLDFEPDQGVKDTIAQFGPAVEVSYDGPAKAKDRLGIRTSIQQLCCYGENVAWIDPLQPVVLKAGEGISLTQQGSHRRKIRFRRIVSHYSIHWFAFVDEGTQLSVNGQAYPRTSNLVIGPFPPFSVVEYHNRAVFLYLTRESIDYKPKVLDARETISNIVANFKNDLNSKSGRETAATTAALARGETIDTKISVRAEPEIQPDDINPCEYFRGRMQAWKLLQKEHPVVLGDPAERIGPSGRGAWLVDSVIYRAIASVTTAIELENNVQFAMIDEEGYRQARGYGRFENQELITTGHNGDLLLPYNTDADGVHWLLVHVTVAHGKPEIHVYDTLNMVRGDERGIRATVVNTRLFDISKDEAQSSNNIKLTHHDVARQPNAWECGYFTILNAWCVALGMKPGTKRHRAASPSMLGDLVDIINLSMSGLMDSATIQAYMRCVGFVDNNHDTIAPDRHFTRSVPFLIKEGVNKYICMRMELEKSPHSVIKRLDLTTIRFLLDPTNSGNLGDLEALSPDHILAHFQTWLNERKLSQTDPKSPLSPASPATMRLTFGIAQSIDNQGVVPPVIPEDTRVLRKIWNIYHTLLKQQGVLGQARQDRAREMREGSFSTQEIADDNNYPYDDPKLVALDRLGMMPTTYTLTQHDIECIRLGVHPVRKGSKAI